MIRCVKNYEIQELWILRFAWQFLCEHETSADRQSKGIRHTPWPNVKTESKNQGLQESILFKSVFFDDNLKASDVVEGPWRYLKILLRHGKGREQNNNKMYSNFWDLRNHWNQCSERCSVYPLCVTLSCNPESITITVWIISLIPKICNHNHLNHFLLPAWAQKKKCNQRGMKKVYRSSAFVDTWQSLGILTFVTSKI